MISVKVYKYINISLYKYKWTPQISLDTLYVTTSPAFLRQVHAYFSMKIFIIKVRESRGRSSGGCCVCIIVMA